MDLVCGHISSGHPGQCIGLALVRSVQKMCSAVQAVGTSCILSTVGGEHCLFGFFSSWSASSLFSQSPPSPPSLVGLVNIEGGGGGRLGCTDDQFWSEALVDRNLMVEGDCSINVEAALRWSHMN